MAAVPVRLRAQALTGTAAFQAAEWGVPLVVGGPPARSAAGSWRAARMGFHWKVGGPRHPGHPRHPGLWQGGLARKAISLRKTTGTTGVPPVAWNVHGPSTQRARCALSQWACCRREAPSRRRPGCLGSLVRLGQGAGARSGQVPAWPTARRQDGGVPSQAYARSIDWDSRLPGGGMGNACAADPTTVKRPKQPEGQHRSRRRSAMSCCQNKGRYR